MAAETGAQTAHNRLPDAMGCSTGLQASSPVALTAQAFTEAHEALAMARVGERERCRSWLHACGEAASTRVAFSALQGAGAPQELLEEVSVRELIQFKLSCGLPELPYHAGQRRLAAKAKEQRHRRGF